MKLYNVPNNTWIRSLEPDCEGLEFKFEHIDGMYSYCHDKDDNLCHYPAWMEVEIIQNGYDCHAI